MSSLWWKNIYALGAVMTIALVAWAIETLRDRRPALFGRLCLGAVVTGIVALVLVLTLHFAHARDLGQWEAADDDRDDAPLRRPHLDIGTEIEIPPNKLKWDKSNPTGQTSCSSVAAATCSVTCSRAERETT